MFHSLPPSIPPRRFSTIFLAAFGPPLIRPARDHTSLGRQGQGPLCGGLMGASTFNADAHIERKELRVARSRISLALSVVGPRSPARWRSQGAPWRDRGPDATFSYIRLEHRRSADRPLRPIRAMADTALGGLSGSAPGCTQRSGGRRSRQRSCSGACCSNCRSPRGRFECQQWTIRTS
jgi:hypothetical protein